MAGSPVKHALKRGLRASLPFLVAGSRYRQPPSQDNRFCRREILQIDAPADVERRQAGVTNQIRWRRDTEQTEGESIQNRFVRAPVVAFSNSGEKLVGREREASDDVDFVHKDDERTIGACQNNSTEQGCETQQWAKAILRNPELLQFLFTSELLAHEPNQSCIPLFGGEILTDGREVEHDDGDSVGTQPSGGADHERGLAHLARRQHVTEFTALETLVKLRVRPPFDVRSRVRPQRAACDVERTFASVHNRWCLR